MSKRILSVILCVILLLVGCGKVNEDIENQDQIVELPVVDMENENISLVWKNQGEYSVEVIPFVTSAYSPKVPQYRVSQDLGNIENIHRFKGFSKDQIDKLVNNGFVVLDPNHDRAYQYMKMYNIYENNEYLQIPNFITVDSAIHLYHRFFGETLKSIEEERLFATLQQLSQNILNKIEIVYDETLDRETKELLEDLMVYFAVGSKLTSNSFGNISADLIKTANVELQKIEAADGYSKSPLFGFDINYSQFKPRGHYAGNEILEKYFKAMMWYGLVGYPLIDEMGIPDIDSIRRGLAITYFSFLEVDGFDDISLWDKIYAPTNFFVGQSDDINIFDMKEVILKVYGEKVELEDFNDDTYNDKLIEEINKLPEPQIQHKLVTGAVDTPTGKQFRFMGQRYTLDANIMQELMVPIIRPVPSGLDVVAAFGSTRAQQLVEMEYLMNLKPEEYSILLQPLQNKVKALTEADWQQNLYNGWLWALKDVWSSKKNTEGLPFFMKNQGWYDKNIQTGLGSYAELKHDTILYAKQPAAEMGGGEEVRVYYPNYVEPAVEVYDKLLWLVQYSKINLDKRNLLSDRIEVALTELEKYYMFLRDCAIKHLENKPLTEEENNLLRIIGGRMEFIDNMFAVEYNKALSSAVIADVAGIADVGLFLEIASGLPNEIYVAINDEDRVYLARGVVYGYYEFLSSTPLTDQEWRALLGVEKIEEEGWEYERINSEILLKNAPPQPDWINSFKSTDKNRVEISPVEYVIEN